jgi:hypothetical protein
MTAEQVAADWAQLVRPDRDFVLDGKVGDTERQIIAWLRGCSRERLECNLECMEGGCI